MNLLEKPSKELIKLVYKENRQNLIKYLKKNTSLDYSNSVLFLKGAYELPVYDEDVEYLLRPETFFHYLFGVTDPDCYAMINLENGNDYLFIPQMDVNKAVWFKKRDINEFKNDYSITNVKYISDIKDIFEELKINKVYLNSGINPYSNLKTLIPDINKDFDFMNNMTIDTDFIYQHLCECKLFKSENEIKLIKYSCEVASLAHKDLLTKIKPGVKEIFLQNQFMAFCQSTGSPIEPYSMIVGSGKNASVLHYDYNHYVLENGKLILIDAGSYNNFYASDITITSPINGKFTEKQKNIYNIVYEMQKYVFDNIKIDKSYQSLQNEVEKLLIGKLLDLGLLKNLDKEDIDQLWNKRLSYYFFPHGIGHYIGISVHDHLGLSKPENEDKMKIVKQNLRVSRKLEKGMVLTNEPGVYFIDLLLNKAKNDVNISKYFNFEIIREYQDEVDGIRIEDVFAVTDTGYTMLTNKPRTVEEIEEAMSKK